MRLVGEVNRYVTDTHPFNLKTEEELPRLRTVLWVLAQSVSDLNTMLAPFLPHSANAVDAVMGGAGRIAPMPRLVWVSEGGEDGLLAEAPGTPEDVAPDSILEVASGRYPVITGDYAGYMTWGRHDVEVGTPIAKPTPVFTKLDPSIVEEELERYASR